MKNIKIILLLTIGLVMFSCSGNKDTSNKSGEGEASYSKGQSLVNDDVSQMNILQIAITQFRVDADCRFPVKKVRL